VLGRRPIAGRRRCTDGVQAHRRYGRNSQGSTIPGHRRRGGVGFISGLTGVGGGVFRAPLLIAFGWASPKREAALSPPFILVVHPLEFRGGIGGRPCPGTLLYSVRALAGVVIGTVLGRHWMSESATRYSLAVIPLFAVFARPSDDRGRQVVRSDSQRDSQAATAGVGGGEIDPGDGDRHPVQANHPWPSTRLGRSGCSGRSV
jgi:hypothetical protein